MGTPFTDLYDSVLSKIRDYDFFNMEQEQVYEVLSDYLRPAIAAFRGCKQDISQRTETGFECTLTDTEVEILANYMTIAYLDSNYIRVPLALKQTLSSNVPVFEREIELDDESKTTVVDIEKTYELCKAINLIHNVKDNAFQALVAELRGMTVEKLDYMKQMRFCAEERMLSKAREELENGVAMVAAIGQQLNETLANASGLNNMAEAMKNFDYDKMVDSVLSHK